MSYLKEFNEMTAGKYIKESLLNDLDNSLTRELKNDIREISEKLQNIDGFKLKIEDVLYYMTILSCIKKALEMKVRINVLNDARDKTRKYLQARGAVPFKKGTRIWASYYLGAEHTFEDGKNNPKVLIEGRSEVIRRVLIGLKDAMGLY